MSRKTFTDEFDGFSEWGAENFVRSRWLHQPGRPRDHQARIYRQGERKMKPRQRSQGLTGHGQMESQRE